MDGWIMYEWIEDGQLNDGWMVTDQWVVEK